MILGKKLWILNINYLRPNLSYVVLYPLYSGPYYVKNVTRVSGLNKLHNRMDYGTQNWVLQEESQNVECTCITGRDRTCYVPSSSPSEKTPTISQSKNIWSSKNLKWQPQHRWPHLLVTPIDLWGRNKASKSDVDSNRCAVKNPIALSQWWPHHCVVHTTLLLSLVQPLRIFYLLCSMCEVF